MGEGGGSKFFTRNGKKDSNGAVGGEVGFIIGGRELFKVSLHSWQRGANPPIL